MKELWPRPEKLGIPKIYERIESVETFNKVVGNPENWRKILNDEISLNSWILPNAILLFGKRWFDEIKWKTGKTKGLCFPVISDETREEAKKLGVSIDDLPASRSVIARIIEATSKSLKKYLEGRWYDGEDIKQPGAYITESIKNNVIREIGIELGYKSRIVPICPHCFSNGNKVVLVCEGLDFYSCPNCTEKLKNFSILLDNPDEKENALRQIEKIEKYVYFQPDKKLPTMHIWVKPDEVILDDEKLSTSNLASGQLSLDDDISNKQKVKILLEETTIKMASLNVDNFSGFISWCFYLAVANWMFDFWKDASLYFFGWKEYERCLTEKEMFRFPEETSKRKIISVIRGQSGSIHQSIFHIWMNVIEKNMNKIRELRPDIKNIWDFKWFCRPPKFSGGPISVFDAEISSRMSIPNNSDIKQLKGNIKPRMAKILSIRAHNKDYVEDVRLLRWRSIHISPRSELKPKDSVKVEAIMMSGHCTHAPIQRILRLRSSIFKDIINRVIKEEKTGERDIYFWKSRNKKLERARTIIKERENV